MYKFLKTVLILLIILPVLTGCPPPPPEVEYQLNISAKPDGAQDFISVAPDKETFEEGESVTISASSGGVWVFERWSGSGISSTENPLTINMNKDYDIIANFNDGTENFSVEIPVTDGVYSQKVTLVSDDDAAILNDLDSNDREGPPIAPPGAFFTGSAVGSINLYKDVRPADDRIVWELRLNRASGETMSLENWTISENLEGTLILVDNPDDSTPDIEIDMQSDASYSISDPSIQRLYVVYEKPEPAKMITNVDDQRFDEMIDVEPDPSKEKSLKDKTGIGNKKNIKRNNR